MGNQNFTFFKQIKHTYTSMKLLQFCVLVLIGFLAVEIESKRGGKGKGRWNRKGGKGRGKGKGKFRGKSLIHGLIKDDLMTCKVDECWPTCFTQGCIDCKTACYNEHENSVETKAKDEDVSENKAAKKDPKKARKALKSCNKNCKKSGVCPKWKNVPKVCKKCMKGCYKTTLENSKSLDDFSKSCSGDDKCGQVCWGPSWKSKACKTCVQEKCVEEEEK